MIVYHHTQKEKVLGLLTDGLRRRDKRYYVFDKWKLVFENLQGVARDTANVSTYGENVVLVLDVDEDTLVQSPVPRAKLAKSLDGKTIERLQEKSFFLETDLVPSRIVAIKDAWGNDCTNSFVAPKKKLNALPRFLAYARPYSRLVFFATAAGVGKFLVPLAFPYILRLIIDEVLLSDHSLELKEQKIFDLITFALGLNVLWMLFTYLRNYFSAKAGHSMIRDLRVSLYKHVQRLSHQFFATNPTSTIVYRVVTDIQTAQNFVGSALTNVWMDGILLLVLLGILLSINEPLTVVALCLMPLFIFSITVLGKHIRRVSREVQQRMEVITGGLQEKVAGVTIVKGFTRESAEATAFQTQANKLFSKTLHSVRFATLNEMLTGFVVLSSPVVMVWYGSKEILAGRLTVGELTQFLLYLGHFYAPIQRFSDLSVMLSSSLGAINRIFEFFDTQPQVAEKVGALSLNSCAGKIEFKNVSFGYDKNAPVIKDVSLIVEPGQTMALVGPSGSGKSTLANLLPRFYDPTSGVVALDDYDLRDLNLESLRHHIGIVSQETILFSGTVRENLLLAKPDATPEEVLKALDTANAREFVEELPEGLWTEIGERGFKLSGGQRQRLAIARAFLKNPQILILDEATSSLDTQSEHLIQEALSRLLWGRTALVIAHRLSTILGADKIVVMSKGRIVEEGKHEELLKKGGLYSELFEIQVFKDGKQ